MRVTIELKTGARPHRPVQKSDMDRNIEALQRAIDHKPRTALDDQLLIDTLSILEGLKNALPY